MHWNNLQLGTTLLLVSVQCAVALWPAPRVMTRGTGTLRLSNDFKIQYNDARLSNAASIDLEAAVQRTMSRLNSDSMQLLQLDRGASLAKSIKKASELSALQLSLTSNGRVASIASETNLPYKDQDETYTLNVPSGTCPNGVCSGKLLARTALGLLRGLTTFEQLVYVLPTSPNSRFIPNAPVLIDDAPAFPHRAFMLDTSRNFFSVDDIQRTLDTMASVKLNVLHWHATDSQSWPLSLPSFPELVHGGAYSSAQVYSQKDISDIQRYANSRGISVMLEIDMPGHTASIAGSHPEHIACLGLDSQWATYSNEPPTGQLKLGVPSTQNFAAAIIQDASKMMTSPYFSTGGDEVNAACYKVDPDTSAALSNSTLDTLLSRFVKALHSTLSTARKIPVVWEEMVLDHQLGLSPNKTIVLVWISSDNVRKVVDQGYQVIHAASNYLYLDCGAGGWIGGTTGNSWCDPFKSWQKIYSFDPYASISIAQQHLILGGETLLWTEQTDGSNLDPITWPRAAAAAEVFWTHNTSRSAVEALPRLHDWRYRAVRRGIRAIPIQPEYCALRPGVCKM